MLVPCEESGAGHQYPMSIHGHYVYNYNTDIKIKTLSQGGWVKAWVYAES